MSDDLAHLEPNPDYGTGYFVRAWRMRRIAGDCLEVTMEDSSHALAMRLVHDATRLTAIDARWERSPITSCSGAELQLRGMVGCPLGRDPLELTGYVDSTSHCTHMLDTCRLGVVHIARGRPDRRYDVIVPDIAGGLQPIRMLIDGEPHCEIAVDAAMIVRSPAALAGVPLMRGFARHARAHLDSDTAEILYFMQKTAFVARGRRIHPTFYYGAPAQIAGPPAGTCFASQPDRYRDARRKSNEHRDLTVETALQFGFDSAPE